MPREGHDKGFVVVSPASWISIHVPREGHDYTSNEAYDQHGISIHVPREGHDIMPANGLIVCFSFQSTCPARGTTIDLFTDCGSIAISIHVPREGHDTLSMYMGVSSRNFNPRAPRGARRK